MGEIARDPRSEARGEIACEPPSAAQEVEIACDPLDDACNPPAGEKVRAHTVEKADARFTRVVADNILQRVQRLEPGDAGWQSVAIDMHGVTNLNMSRGRADNDVLQGTCFSF